MSRELDRDMQGGGRLPGAATLQRSRVTHARSGRWWRSLRERGLVAAARAAARRVYRSHAIIVNRTDLRGPAVPDRVGDIVFRLATEADLDRLAQLDGVGRGSRQWAYVVEDNDWLFVACDGERIIATVRLAPGSTWAGAKFGSSSIWCTQRAPRG